MSSIIVVDYNTEITNNESTDLKVKKTLIILKLYMIVEDYLFM